MTDKEKLRKNFFELHTIKKEGIPIVNTSPHNLFEYFWINIVENYYKGHREGYQEGCEDGEQRN